MASFGAAAQSSDVTYTYDALGRLVGADYSSSNSTITYTYDAAGNRTSVVTTAPNQPPIAVDDSYTQQPGTSVLHNVLANDTDLNGDPLSIATESGSFASISGSQILVDAPVAAGVYVFDYTISDGTDVSAPATVTITVPNVAPVATNDTGSQLEGSTNDYDVLSNDSDANNNTLTLTNVTGSQASIVSNQVRFNSTSGPGTYPVNYTVSDGNGLNDTATLTVTVTANQTWSWSPTIPTQTPDEGVSYTLDLSGFGSDPEGDSVTYAATGLPAGLSVVGSSITGTPTESGTFSVTVDATDSGSSTAVSTSFNMNVTAAPNQSWSWSQTIPTQTPDEGVSYALDLSTFGSDPEGDSVTYAATGLPAGLSVAGSSITGTPSENGSFSISVDATDSGSSTAVSTSFSMNVTAAPNQSWTWTQTIPTQSPDEGVSYALDLSTFGSDPEGDSVTYAATGLPAGLSVVGSSITGTPTENGSFTVSVDATDSGSNTAVSTSFSMNVTAASGSQPAVLLFDDQLQNGTAFYTQNLSVAALSSGGEPVYSGTTSVKITGGVWNQGGLAINRSGLNATNGLLRLRLYREVGSDAQKFMLYHSGGSNLTLQASNSGNWSVDGQPATGGVSAFTPGTWHLVEIDLTGFGITEINNLTIKGNGDGGDVYYLDDVALWAIGSGGSPPPPPPPPPPPSNPPNAVDDAATTNFETAVSFDAFTNDSKDIDNQDFVYQSHTQGTNGSVSHTGTGTFQYTPNTGFSGTDTFTYAIVDTGGDTDTATVTVTVNPNQSWTWSQTIPTQTPDEGVSYALDLSTFGSDPEGDPVTYAATGLPAGLSVVGSSITGTPTENGSFTVSVDATDSGSNTAVSTSFSMNVTAAPNQSWTWSQSIPTQSPVEGVSYTLDLSTFGSDPEGDTVTYSATGLPAGLSVLGSSITGTPTANGSFTVSVDATDSGSNTAVSTSFSMNVTAAGGSQPAVLLFDDQLQNGTAFYTQSLSVAELSSAGEPVYSGANSAKITGGVWNQGGLAINRSGLNATNGLLRLRLYREVGSDAQKFLIYHSGGSNITLKASNGANWSIDGQPATGDVNAFVPGTWHLVEIDLTGFGITEINNLTIKGNGDGGDVYYLDDVALWPTN